MDEKPRLFVGSSSEALDIAETICLNLREVAEIRLWKNVFDLGDTTIETLFDELDRSDYAVLVTSSDDKIVHRGKRKDVARDNVVFEAGLFLGRLGRKRVFVVCDRVIKLPSDLAGVTVVFYDSMALTLESSLKETSARLINAISKKSIEREVDFLHAYLAFIDPRKIELWHTYAEILTDHFTAIRTELDKLRKHGEWSRLLKLKVRLREYFEYSGRYQEGVDFGRAYVEALDKLGRNYEAAWSKIKDVGYMLIQASRYSEGRKEIQEAIDAQGVRASAVDVDSRAKLLFYTYRYLAISYHRDSALRNIDKEYEYLGEALRQLNLVEPNSKLYQELRARWLRNLGHLELEKIQIEHAINHYLESLDLFESIPDMEHIGNTHLALAKALNIQKPEIPENIYTHLKRAQTIFVSIRIDRRSGASV